MSYAISLKNELHSGIDDNDENVSAGQSYRFEMIQKMQINSMESNEHFLIIGGVGVIVGVDWDTVINNNFSENRKIGPLKISWNISIPPPKDSMLSIDVNCLVINKEDNILYAGCGDNAVYAINIEYGEVIHKFEEHRDFIHSIDKLDETLASASEDGSVIFWDIRSKKYTLKLIPSNNSAIKRPDLGNWIGSVTITKDWMLCGGGSKLSLWNRSMAAPMTVYNSVEDSGIHVTKLMDETLYAGGCSKYFYQLSFTDEILCKIKTSPVSVYTCINQENPFKVTCLAGSSHKIDVCTKLNYKMTTLGI
ncbi:Hypothetical protein CINCED_3A014929 [Cinara cedri]|uniref:Uncharacterized protein n=1 Tax=Cinara cedri TaxID=506608 RepID=A0A5E4N1X1_9HEMI|nr:Hypothetical protein CINCED_3A014929 [Cinara cedri]